MRVKSTKYQKGDTLIEVLLAITSLAFVLTIMYSVMKNGIAMVQISLDRTTTQAMVNGEAAMLRDSQRQSAANWSAVKAKVAPIGTKPNPDGCTKTTGVDRIFYFDPAIGATPQSQTTARTLRSGTSAYYGDGMWIEAYRVNDQTDANKPPYYDFYIKACWDSPYGGVRQQMKTIVRLYDV